MLGTFAFKMLDWAFIELNKLSEILSCSFESNGLICSRKFENVPTQKYKLGSLCLVHWHWRLSINVQEVGKEWNLRDKK